MKHALRQLGVLVGWWTALAAAAEPPLESTSHRVRDEPGLSAAREPAASPARPVVPPTPNPLEPFLGKWMTPRDHALLRQGPLAAVEPVPTPSFPLRPPPSAHSAAQPAAPNPYLEAMQAPAAAVAPTGPKLEIKTPPPSKAGSETGLVLPTLTAPETSPPAVPSRYRPPPAADAKYFPQQKRF